ncbi:MAG TPA: DNA helicase RecG, partial [Anaeromyxobacteraceae bacterium]
MPSRAGGPHPTDRNADAAAEHLAALVPPLRFATRDGFAALARLSGFAELLRGAVARARAAGAPASPALEGLAAAGEGFDALPLPAKQRALLCVAGHLSSLIPVPGELRELAARGRVEVRAPTPTSNPTSTSNPNPNPTAAERRSRRAALRQPLAQLPRVHPAPRALLEER